MNDMVEKVLVLGDGGWGTALAMVLDERGVEVDLWCHDAAYAEELKRSRRNSRYLPGIEFSSGIHVVTDPGAAERCTAIFSVVPSQFLEEVLTRFQGVLEKGKIIVSCTKGIVHEGPRRPSELIREQLGDVPLVILNGPSHAEEVARGMPTTVVAASEDAARAMKIQDLLTTDRFRVYTNDDPIGVELAGAVKNVLSIAGGVVDGLGLGDNTKAALLTRGIVEMARLGVAMGADRETFFGLAGIGDLVTSCTSQHGRNRRVGERLGQGEKLEDVVGNMLQVAEGVRTAEAVKVLADRHGVEMPICTEVYRILYEGKETSTALRDLMTRQVKDERQW